jgi:hypothetical protein
MLQLQHTTAITDFVNLYTLLAAIGVFVVALIVFCFSRGWVGLLIGFVLLVTPLGYGAYQVKAFYDSQHPGQLNADNAQQVQQWAGKTYGIKLSDADAKRLVVGTTSFDPAKSEGQGIPFGRTTSTKTITVNDDATIVAPVALLWNKDKWVLASVSDSGDQYNSIPTRR